MSAIVDVRRLKVKSVGASVQSTTDSRAVSISGSNAGYTMFRGSVKGTGYPLHSPFPPSLPLPCVTVYHHFSTGLYLWKGRVVGGGESGAHWIGEWLNPTVGPDVLKGGEKAILGWILFRDSQLASISIYGSGTPGGHGAASMCCIYPSCLLWQKSWRRRNNRDSCYCALERARGAGNKETNELKKECFLSRVTQQNGRVYLWEFSISIPYTSRPAGGGSGGGGVAEVIVLLVCDTVSLSKLSPTFRSNILVSSSDHILTLEEQTTKLSRNIASKLSNNATSRPWRTNSHATPLRKPETLHGYVYSEQRSKKAVASVSNLTSARLSKIWVHIKPQSTRIQEH